MAHSDPRHDADAPALGQVPLIERFWLDYQRERDIKVEGFSATAFGHTRRLADMLAELVRHGAKRAYASLRRDFDGEALPQVGEHVVVLDGDGRPQVWWVLRASTATGFEVMACGDMVAVGPTF